MWSSSPRRPDRPHAPMVSDSLPPAWLTGSTPAHDIASDSLDGGGLPDQSSFNLPTTSLPRELSRLLFVSWVIKLSADRFALTRYGGGEQAGRRYFSFGDDPAGFLVSTALAGGPWRLEKVHGLPQVLVTQLLQDAVASTASGDFGADVVYQVEMATRPTRVDAYFALHGVRILTDQVRLLGRRRLADRAMLEFTEAPDHPPGVVRLFAPVTQIRALLFVPGPTAGPLSKQVAISFGEVVAAACSLALGRCVALSPTSYELPASAEVAASAGEIRHAVDIPGLSRDSVSLDVFGELFNRGGAEALARSAGALLAYHGALQESNADLATMSLVTAIEALILPRGEWRKDKVTKRFIEAVQDLCPQAVDEVLLHADVEEAFVYTKGGGSMTQRDQLLNRIHELKSALTHEGMGRPGTDASRTFGHPAAMRVALLSGLARAAMLSFIQAPRSFQPRSGEVASRHRFGSRTVTGWTRDAKV